MKREIIYNEKKHTLMGRNLKEESQAPDFTAQSIDLGEFKLSDHKNQVKVISSVVSLDKPLCLLQVNEFNRLAQNHQDEALIAGISNDLPYNQNRVKEANDLNHIKLLSDYKTHNFGLQYGLQIKDLNLLAPSVVIVDKSNVIRYMQIAEDADKAAVMTPAFNAFEMVLKNPVSEIKESAGSHCVPCEGNITPLKEKEIQPLLPEIPNWEVIDNIKLHKSFKFNNFEEAGLFVDIISAIAQEQDHHPDICIYYNKVDLILTTHSVGGLSRNDFIMAGLIDETLL